MAEDNDDSSKTEDPSQKRLDDARKRGQVALSREVNNALVLLAATVTMAGFSPWIVEKFRLLFLGSLGEAHLTRLEIDGLRSLAGELGLAVAVVAGPIVLAVLVAGVAAGFVQVGWMTAPEALKGWCRISTRCRCWPCASLSNPCARWLN